MNEQILSVIVAALIGFFTNVIIKRIEKQKEPEDKQRIAVETAEISLDMAKQTLEIVEKRNKELEELLNNCKEIERKNNELYALFFSILNDEEVYIPPKKREEYLSCIMSRRSNA